MSTAQIIYEQYKVLPKKVQNELIALINKNNDEENVRLIDQVTQGLREVKLIREGKLKALTLADVFDE